MTMRGQTQAMPTRHAFAYQDLHGTCEGESSVAGFFGLSRRNGGRSIVVEDTPVDGWRPLPSGDK